MPLLHDKDTTWYAAPPTAAAANVDHAPETLKAWKAEYYADWQEFKSLLQQAHKGAWGADVVAIFKESEAFNRRRYRATTYMLPKYANQWPGDCKNIDQRKWPPDLADDIDALFLRLVA